ncbi:hypothetical protein [Roseibacillus persicicus]|uniref:DUF4303 domain-containing protein n=1 Tax=Roseibacillus persicicus TaxID=454148 RepID=A0A918WQY3_9BACT|nr:hypothetical protein [Roseibacillus persicicus]GHC68257.1 hypothetical protein GCM10007100_40370 [Roseibacillus persicicus]
MQTIAQILSQIESRWEVVARKEIDRAVTDSKLEDVYVAGFWLFYTDGSAFYPPYLSINSRSGNLNLYDKWSPPEWLHGLDGATDAMASEYEPLMEALRDKPESEWDNVIEQHYELISRVSQSLTKTFREEGAIATTDDFLACILDHQHGDTESERLSRLSIGGIMPEDLQRFFADRNS